MTPSSTTNHKQEKACRDMLGRLPDFKGHLLFWPIAIIGAIVDLWSKQAVFDWLPTVPDQTWVVIDGFFQLILRENDGAAFSIMRGQRIFLVGILVVAFFAVIGFFLAGGVHRRIIQLAMGCMLSGIMGNFYDRAFNNGLVRDFFDVFIGNRHWPTFNVADSMLCIGVGLLMIANLTAPKNQSPKS